MIFAKVGLFDPEKLMGWNCPSSQPRKTFPLYIFERRGEKLVIGTHHKYAYVLEQRQPQNPKNLHRGGYIRWAGEILYVSEAIPMELYKFHEQLKGGKSNE